jgi:cyclopropane fatty-acyl-phospholipid synthase-like methyltransferase
MNNREQETRSYYEPRVRAYTKGYEIHDWEDSASEYRRFDVLLDAVDLNGMSLLDVGCGIGDLYHYLVTGHKTQVMYTGVDLLEAMIERAKNRFPEANFITEDLTENDPFGPESFDVVFCSGVFNLKIGDHDRFARTMLPILAKLSRKFLVFNMLHTDSPDRNSRYCYFDPDDVVRWRELSPMNPRVVSGYQANDFSVVCVKYPEDC